MSKEISNKVLAQMLTQNYIRKYGASFTEIDELDNAIEKLLTNELEALRARLQATEAALQAAGELIEAIRYGLSGQVTIGSMEKYERMKAGFEAYVATRARVTEGEG